jgi:AcrR family transcriptional regulator
MAPDTPTRQRLLEEGMRLFAEHGFRATTVGQIEAAAGLQPRRGALYKHFESKEALLLTALQRHREDAGRGAAQIAAIDFSHTDTRHIELRPLLLAFGRWFLDEMDRLRELTLVLEHDGPRLGDLTAELKRDIVDTGNGAAARLVAVTAPHLPDPDATATLLLGGLVVLRRTEWTYGGTALDVDDGRALEAWADIVAAALRPL